MLGNNKDEGDSDPTLEQEFFIGGWDPYVVEITRLKRDKANDNADKPDRDRRTHEDRRKS